MGLFDKQIAFINSLEAQIYNDLQVTLEAFDFVVLDYVRNKQLFQKGIDGKGKKLQGYTRTTIRIKQRKGDPYNRTTLRDEGEFYASLVLTAGPDGFEISTDVPHADKLTKRYGKDILRPTNENFAEFMRVYFLPNLKRNVKTKMK